MILVVVVVVSEASLATFPISIGDVTVSVLKVTPFFRRLTSDVESVEESVEVGETSESEIPEIPSFSSREDFGDESVSESELEEEV